MKRVNKILAAVLIGCMVFAFPGVTLGIENMDDPVVKPAIELTLDDAVNRALDKSYDLKIAEYDIERSEEVRDEAVDDVNFTPTGAATPTATATFTGLVAKDLAWQMSKKSKDMASDRVVASAFQYYTGILGAQEKVEAAEKALANAEWQQKVAQLGYQVGTVSESGNTLAKANYEGKKAALEAARANLEDSYHKLNTLLGLNPDDRPVLKDKPEMVLLKVDDLEQEVHRRVEESPSVWLADQNTELAQINLDLYNWSSATEPYAAKEIDVNTAVLDAASAKDQLRKLVRTLYYSVRQMEDQYATLDQTLKSAEENLRVKQVQFDAGMATKGDLISAENDLAGARQALRSLVYQHELYKIYFNKPWAYSAGS